MVDLWTGTEEKRERKFFKNREDAETYAERKRTERKNHGLASLAIPDELRREAYDLTQKLHLIDPSLTLSKAVEHFIKHARPDGGVKTVQEVIDELTNVRRDAGRNPDYLRVSGVMYGRFARTFGTRPIHSIISKDLREWIASHQHWSPTTRLNYRRNLAALFSFAFKHRYCPENPAKLLERPKLENKPPGILTAQQVKTMLDYAVQEEDESTKLFIAIGGFAGLRVAEIERLDWSEVDLRGKLIEVTAAKAKTRQRRHVTISPNLRAWLLTIPAARRTGPVIRDLVRIDRFAKRAGVGKWPKNGLRHSFVSYHLAQHQNAALTATQAGHDQELLFRNYRELVRKTTATEYWKIRPKT